MVIERWSKCYANVLAKEMNQKSMEKKNAKQENHDSCTWICTQGRQLHANRDFFIFNISFSIHILRPQVWHLFLNLTTLVHNLRRRVVWWRQRGDFWYTLRRILWFRGCKSQSLFNFSKVDSRILRMILHLLTSITRPPVMNHPTISTKKPRCHWNLKIKQHTSQSIQLEVNKKSSSWLNLKTELLLFGKTFQCSTFTNSFMEKLQPLQPPALAMAAGKVSRIWSTTESLAPQLFTNLFSRTCWKSDPIGGSPTKTHPFLVWLRTHNRIRKRREMRSIWPRWSWKNLTFSCPCSSLGPPAICPLLHEAGKFMYLVVWGPTKGRLPKVKVFLTEPADLLFARRFDT